MIDIGLPLGFNTDVFREPALTFEKTGKYTNALKGTRDYKEYWDVQEYYCKNGISVGGVKIVGEHYFYLNFCQIVLKRNEDTGINEVSKSKIKQIKVLKFPDFWDSDFYYFNECEAAKQNNQHLIILKPRRRGYSYKNAAKCVYNYTFFRNSTSLIIAEQSGYSESTLMMGSVYLDFLIKHTDFGKTRIVDKPRSHMESGFSEILPDGRKVISGYRSKILALTAKNNPDVARGRDANVILFEECGSFSNLKSTYLATLPTVQAGKGVSGTIYAFGTGGDFSGGIVDFEDMFYNPEPYSFRSFDNSWEEGMSGNKIGYFLPDYYSKDGFILDNGESQIDEASAFIEAEVERIKRTAKDVNTIDKFLSENPVKPSQAFIKSSSNIFPKGEIQIQINRLKGNDRLNNLGIPGYLEQTETGSVLFKPSQDVKPIRHYPYKQDEDGEGCMIQYQPPYKTDGYTPPDLYFIMVDPFALDKGKDKIITKRDSLGAVYVMKRVNNFSKPYDMIVAEYIARPKLQDDFNRQLFLLAQYYRAKIVFENDRDGNIVAYARTHKLLHWLEEELTVYDSNDSPKRKLGRVYGVSMSSIEVKKQAVQYLRDWLISKRETNENGEFELNLHKIYSIPLLEELLSFNYEGNFDRVSALLVGMLYKKELLLKPDVQKQEGSFYKSDFFDSLRSKLGFKQNY